MTQSYADFSAQISFFIDSAKLSSSNFNKAEKLITGLVLAAVRPDARRAAVLPPAHAGGG